MLDKQIHKLKDRFGKLVQENIPFATLTTVGLGGPAKTFIKTQTAKQLIEVLQFAKQQNIPFLVIGGGSNLLVSDQGIDKLVIQVNNQGIIQDQDKLLVEAGTKLQALVDFTINQGLAGIHKMAGIPGSVGGAVYGNAGAYGQMIGDFISKVIASDNGQLIELSPTQCGFSYRSSNFKTNGVVILQIAFTFPQGKKQQLQEESAKCLELRQKKYHPGTRCPGSFFRNFLTSEIPQATLKLLPERFDTYGKTPAYVFIESLGGKGDRIGDIEIASFHGNLFINLGKGTTKDFWTLANKWYQLVKDKYGIKLEPEVQLINLPPLGSEVPGCLY